MCPYCAGLVCLGLRPCPLGPEYKPVAKYSPCGRCGAMMHPLNNCRVLGPKVVCMPCYEGLIRKPES